MATSNGPAVPSANDRLRESYLKLAAICRSIHEFTPSDHVYQPPILDSHDTRYTPQEISGLPKFRSTCETEADWLEEEAARSFKRNIAGRRLVDVKGPLGQDTAAVTLGRSEGLDGHARSVAIRLNL